MPPRRSRLDGRSIQEVIELLRTEHPSPVRIVSAERVRVPGLPGLLGRRRVEVEVEWEEPSAAELLDVAEPALVFPPAPGQRVGIAALLAEADAEEARDAERYVPEAVESSAAEFDDVLARLRHDLGLDAAAAPPPGPRPLGGAGDLVLVVGRGSDVDAVLDSMLGEMRRPSIYLGGETEGHDATIADRRQALAARAAAVASGETVVIGWRLADRSALTVPDALAGLQPDQTWAVVDAGRKPGDTAAWLNALGEVVPVDALAVVGADATASATTVEDLGAPIGWVDGEFRARLRA